MSQVPDVELAPPSAVGDPALNRSLDLTDLTNQTDLTDELGSEGATAPFDLVDPLAAPRPEESDPLQMPWWLTDRTRRKRERQAAERVPNQIYHPALASFFSNGWISDVTLLVKSGKEATVYCCAAQPSTGYDLVAAKVYRPVGIRHNRNPEAAYQEAELRHSFERKVKVRTFTWDSRYREGRQIKDARLRRAYESHTRTGRDVQNASWARYEYETLRRLYAAGAVVPKPLAQAGNAVLMEYVGDASGPAPLLQQADIRRDQAEELFWSVIRNIALWLDCGLVHADLSAYNLLYWQGRIVAIDFPQAVDAFLNSHAFDFLQRDVANVAKCFARHGVSVDADLLAHDLWSGAWQPQP
jgi:RIO kinase 1